MRNSCPNEKYISQHAITIHESLLVGPHANGQLTCLSFASNWLIKPNNCITRSSCRRSSLPCGCGEMEVGWGNCTGVCLWVRLCSHICIVCERSCIVVLRLLYIYFDEEGIDFAIIAINFHFTRSLFSRQHHHLPSRGQVTVMQWNYDYSSGGGGSISSSECFGNFLHTSWSTPRILTTCRQHTVVDPMKKKKMDSGCYHRNHRSANQHTSSFPMHIDTHASCT